jgi:hypothetical protein
MSLALRTNLRLRMLVLFIRWSLVLWLSTLALCFSAVLIQYPAAAPRPAPSATPTPTPSPPVIEFQAVADREVVERGKQINVFIFVTNKSDKAVKLSEVTVSSGAFTATPLKINSELKPFQSHPDNLSIEAKTDAPFIQNKLFLQLTYTWNVGAQLVTSAQTATMAVTVRRQFDEEARGFPGGTAAFLYLLLPVIPALLSYQLIERWRKGEGWHLPTFGSEQIVPAFLLAVVLSFVILWAGINYSNPVVFVVVLLISFLVGAVVPLKRSASDARVSRTWGFKDNDCAACYVRKALLSDWSPAEFSWATGRVGRVAWQGILLEQPGGAKVLGAALQVSRSNSIDDARWAALQINFFDGNRILNRAELVQLIESGELTVSVLDPIVEGQRTLNAFVAVGQVKGFQQTNIDVKNLLRPLT